MIRAIAILRPFLFAVLAVLFISSGNVLLRAQSTTSGDISGVVSDPTGAVIPGAKVTLKNNATGAIQTATSSADGVYRFSLLPPGNYTVSVSATGFAPRRAAVTVSVGQVQTANLKLQVGVSTQTVTVTAEAVPVQTDNANVSTTFSPEQVALVPNPGNDLTATVQTTPGAVMNTQAGYGNFSTFGLPATSNLFTINGQDDNDPFLNLNNSGATNLLLGQNDVQTVTVTNNGYSGQYGELAGANVNYITKSGGNDWHGNAIYDWNGRALNANNFFNNANGDPRAFDNANQWAWSIGGPIVKNKTFFFIDQEGLDVVLPTNTQALIPSPAFQSATLANLTATGNGAQIPFYTSIFNLYNSAPGAAGATPVAGGGCGAFTGLAGGAPCALQFRADQTNQTHEWILAGRLDQVFSSTDRAFVRIETDQGVQATFTDPLNSAFNVDSNQPEYQGQANWTHIVSANAVNQLVASATHYGAIFGTDPAARASVFPATLQFSGGEFTPLGGEDFNFPQGRNVSQYGLVDDLSFGSGNNTFKVGANYKIDFINDYDLGVLTTPLITTSITSFYSGTADAYEQSFPTDLNQPVRLYTLGAYAEDDWRATSHLHFTFAIRGEHDSNPICTHDCISRLDVPFTDLTHDATVPYDSIIQSGLTQTYPSYRHLLLQPRFGFAWTPFRSPNTVLRGGFGIFNDIFPAVLVDDFAENAPADNSFVVTGPLSPAAPGSVFAAAPASNAAFLSGFYSGASLATIAATTPGFAPPNFTSSDDVIQAPRYQEWNLELQQAVDKASAISLNYVGNHGIHEVIQNGAVNAFDPGFVGLPATAPDARFGTVTQIQTDGNSNYNGLTVSYQRHMSRNFEMGANYTWSHALDDVSNGGFLPFNFNTNTSLVGVQDPYNIDAYNYGNSDYDIRHYFSMNYLWQMPFHGIGNWGLNELVRGWTVSGTLFARSGLPLTVLDGAATDALIGNNYAGGFDDAIFANELGNGQNGQCTVTKQCIFPTAFSPSTSTPTGFGDQIRNQFRGPRFFDTDMSLVKNTQFPGWEKGQLGLGFQFFNLFNHPNFDEPVGDIANPQFGTVVNTISVPTSIVGSFLGGDASPRMIQFTARVTF